MYKKVIFLNEQIKEFKSKWNVICKPTPYDNGFYVPLGWEDELTKKGIEFTHKEIFIKEEEEEF